MLPLLPEGRRMNPVTQIQISSAQFAPQKSHCPPVLHIVPPSPHPTLLRFHPLTPAISFPWIQLSTRNLEKFLGLDTFQCTPHWQAKGQLQLTRLVPQLSWGSCPSFWECILAQGRGAQAPPCILVSHGSAVLWSCSGKLC